MDSSLIDTAIHKDYLALDNQPITKNHSVGLGSKLGSLLKRIFGRNLSIRNEVELVNSFNQIRRTKVQKIKLVISDSLSVSTVIELCDRLSLSTNLSVSFNGVEAFDPTIYLLLANRNISSLSISCTNRTWPFSNKYRITSDQIDKELAYLNFNKLKNGDFNKEKLAVLVPVDGHVLYLNDEKCHGFVPIYHNEMMVVFYNKNSIRKRFNRFCNSLPFVNSDVLVEYGSSNQ